MVYVMSTYTGYTYTYWLTGYTAIQQKILNEKKTKWKNAKDRSFIGEFFQRRAFLIKL